ncbi:MULTISPECIES: hypothetical protein [unclassified Microbacterium]|uniref:hypothetical protein n=1 Tax=unclassified Microbacterium TaxID=2609290 RepID=UPI00374748C5
MSDTKTMVRTSIALGDTSFLLAQDQDYEDLKRRIEEALHEGGAFVEFVVVGNRTVSALITGRDRVLLTIETVAYDERDDGDIDEPFGSFFDIV